MNDARMQSREERKEGVRMKISCQKEGGVWYLESCQMQCVETTRGEMGGRCSR